MAEHVFEAAASHLAEHENPAPGEGTLRLRLTSAHGEAQEISIPLEPRRPNIEIGEVVLERGEERALVTSVQNSGGIAANSVSVRGTLALGTQNPPIRFPSIGGGEDDRVDAGGTLPISWVVPADAMVADGAALELVVQELEHPRHVWRFSGVPVVIIGPPWPMYALAAVMLLAGLAVIYYLRVFRHPLLVQVSSRPTSLVEVEPDQLLLARRLLTQTRRLGSVLSSANVAPDWLDRAIGFFRGSDPVVRSALVARRLSAEVAHVSEADGWSVDRLTLPEDFVLNIEHCLMALPNAGQTAQEVIDVLRDVEPGADHLAVIVAIDRKQRQEFRQLAADPANMLVVPSGVELTRLLLSPEPLETFASIVAGQVRVTRISPYQTRGGVAKEAAFFGRTPVLAHILNRDLTNYLLVAGRQIGKSSLLKEIERRVAKAGSFDCRYLSIGLQDGREAMARSLGLASGASFAELVDALGAKPGGRPRLMLVDEADVFVASEASAKPAYETLHAFRNLAEEGRCFFILAGFWKLYEAVSLDYQSPIKNFGETLQLGALEPDACRELITKPMAIMNLLYASEELIERLAHETGGRANLIAIACNEILKGLDARQRVIGEEDVSRALGSEAIIDALGGWQRLTDSERESRLDRIVIYSTIDCEGFTLGELRRSLDDLRVGARAEEIRETLLRLELAYIVAREGDRYAYRVPLFRQIVAREVEFLEHEVRDFA